MTLGLWRHYCAFTIIFIQIIKLSLYRIGQVYAWDQINWEKIKRLYWPLWSLSEFSLIGLHNNLVSNIAAVICTSYQGFNQNDGGKRFFESSLFHLLIFKNSTCCKSIASIKIYLLCNSLHTLGNQEQILCIQWFLFLSHSLHIHFLR